MCGVVRIKFDFRGLVPDNICESISQVFDAGLAVSLQKEWQFFQCLTPWVGTLFASPEAV